MKEAVINARDANGGAHGNASFSRRAGRSKGSLRLPF
jgi:hypothetical protein